MRLFSLIACTAGSFALPVKQTIVGYVAMEADATLFRHGWSMSDSTVAQEQLELTFAVRQQNVDRLTRTVLEVSDPTHPRYGAFLDPHGLSLSRPHECMECGWWMHGCIGSVSLACRPASYSR